MLAEVLQTLLDADDLESFKKEWAAYGRCLAIHAELEDNVFFPLCDKVLFEPCSGIANQYISADGRQYCQV